jgi:hypothetical protein
VIEEAGGTPALPCVGVWYDAGMTPLDSPSLPGFSFTEDSHLTVAKSDRKLRRWGDVRSACKILDECDREILYDLIAIGAVRAYKLRPHRPNSHWKVDLLSVWEHKQRQLAAC